ncbi:hypothetical protein BKA65DRAFT_94157 [Rhexocercosporidium sp. MPI-PUGE-AT-0058]|nr:hypothetical protein BKA65DRAFT_94157 [Rhexocercosporidium sp. MPI-PUGE-AT-0058]
MLLNEVFVVCERTFTHERDEHGSLSIESIHTSLESANRWAQALANNLYDEYKNSAERNDVERQKSSRSTKWGELFAETITTPSANGEFAINYSVEPKDLEGNELLDGSDGGSSESATVTTDQIEAKGVFEGMKFSWVGELDHMEARDEVRYLVFDNGGAWQGIEKCLEGTMSDYIIAGKNIPQRHQKIIEDKDLPYLNRHAFLKMAKDLGLPRPNLEQQSRDPLRCFARMNFTVLGNVEEPGRALSKTLAAAFGTQPICAHTSQMDYVVRRGSDSTADLHLFAEECQKYLKIKNPTVITPKQLAELILKKIENSKPAENPRLIITSESIKNSIMSLDGIRFSVPTGDILIDGVHVQTCIRSEGGQVLGSIHAMDLADYVVTGTNGLSKEHFAMAAQFDVKVINTAELRELIARLTTWKTAKDLLGVAMGYSGQPPPRTRKRKTESTSISQPSRKFAKFVA